MATKNLNTRIALKYDSYENWSKSGIELLPGEVAICEIPGTTKQSVDDLGNTVEIQVAPTVLFKVGGNEKKAFKDLPWASAKAADVYDWAKLDWDSFVTEVQAKAGLATDAELAAVSKIADDLTERIAEVEAHLGLGENAEGSITAKVEALEGAVEVINGTGEGSIAKAAADAKAAAEETAANALAAAIGVAATESDPATGIRKEIADAAAAVQADVDSVTEELADYKASLNKVENKSAAEIKAEFTGAVADGNEGFVTGDAVYDAIEAAKTAASDDAAAQVKELADGQVNDNAEEIAAIKETLETGDFDNRLGAVETTITTFFEDAAKDGEGLANALDTLKEIQDFINTEGTSAQAMLDSITTNKTNIETIQTSLTDTGSFGSRVVALEEASANYSDRLTVLDAAAAGYSADKTIGADIQAAKDLGQQGINAAAAADEKAEDAQTRVGVIEGQLNGDAGLIALVNTVKGTADSAAEDTADLKPRMETAEGAINDLKAVVVNGDDANAKLRSSISVIEALTGVTGEADTGNAKLRSDLNSLAAVVGDANSGLVKVIGNADSGLVHDVADNTERIAAIEADYLTAADEYIFYCGDAAGKQDLSKIN